MRVRIVTINLAGLEFGWFQERSGAMLNGLRALNPDVVCFQEAVIQSHPQTYNQVQAIAGELKLPNIGFASYGKSIELNTPQIGGVAIASRWPLSYAESRRLPSGNERLWDHRIALIATLITPAGGLNVATTHLSWELEEVEMRSLQVGLLLDYLKTSGLINSTAWTLVAGDFNAVSDEPAIKLISENLMDAYLVRHPDSQEITWTGANPYSLAFRSLPDRRIDYLFCSPQAKVLEAKRILDCPNPVFPSDHFGVFAEIDFPG